MVYLWYLHRRRAWVPDGHWVLFLCLHSQRKKAFVVLLLRSGHCRIILVLRYRGVLFLIFSQDHGGVYHPCHRWAYQRGVSRSCLAHLIHAWAEFILFHHLLRLLLWHSESQKAYWYSDRLWLLHRLIGHRHHRRVIILQYEPRVSRRRDHYRHFQLWISRWPRR